MVVEFVFGYRRVELLCALRIACKLELGERLGTETNFGLLKQETETDSSILEFWSGSKRIARNLEG